MNFGEKLSDYMKLLSCSTNDICKESGLSYSIINRYINSKRTPKKNSEYFNKVVDALYQISVKNKIDLTKETIYQELEKAISVNNLNFDFNLFIDNFNVIQQELDITTVEFSKEIGYDTSFISRIKNKKRKPADIENFINKLKNYIYTIISQNDIKRHSLASLLNCSAKDLETKENFEEIFSNYICIKPIELKSDNIYNFLSKLDNFDINDYIGTDFSKIKIPTTPVIFRNSKMYYGIEGRKQAESEFLKTTLLSKSDEPVFYYNDFPISTAAQDEDFKQKWMFIMIRLLKKGLHLNMVHNLNRPINELLLGLENWIPMYMTGSISPYYFKNPPSNIFLTSQCTSGSVALCSECIYNNEKKSKFYLTTKKEEVEFEKEKSKYMLSKALPLMHIYKESDEEAFLEFINKEENKNIQKIEKDIFKNIDFYINDDKWIAINKKIAPQIHFVIYHEKLLNAIKTFLLNR